jgi:ribosome biogenesis GTPase A
MLTRPVDKLTSGVADASNRIQMDSSDRLLRLASLGEELGATRVAEEARDLASRIAEGRFYVACIGQFKRGKSTLINALVGERVLPVGFIPVTTVPTVIRFGEWPGARIKTRDGAWRQIPVSELKDYVSEEHNPENMKAVSGAEVFLPSPLLAGGMCLVDTPGLGSVFAGNTAATEAFVPHIDAVLIVIGADPPLAGEELKLVEAVGRQVQKMIVVLNKADRATEEERRAAANFTRALLEKRLQRRVDRIFEISAEERLVRHGPERDWGSLIETLDELVRNSGRELVRASGERGIERLSEQLLAVVSEERAALERPLEESERRIAAMKETIAGAERAMRELGFLFLAEERRLSDMFGNRHKTFLASVMPKAKEQFEEALKSLPDRVGPSYRCSVMREAQKIAREHVLPWLRVEQGEAEEEYRQVTRRFVEMGNDFLRKLAEAGISELSRMPHALDTEGGFRVKSEFAFLDLIEIAQPASPLRLIADLVLPPIGLRRIIREDGYEFLVRLIETNSTRVQSDILNRVRESRNRLEVEIRKLLHEVSRVAEQALTHARTTQASGASAVQSAFARLDRLEREILNARLACSGGSEPPPSGENSKS